MRRLLVMASDGAYAMPLAIALRSIVESNQASPPIEVLLLCGDFPENARNKVLDSLPNTTASIRWVTINLELFERLSIVTAHVSKMTYARFLLPHILPDYDGKVLYLDPDILVLDDMGSLWETDLQGAVLGAVPDNLDPQIKHGKPGLETIPRVRDYFNAGVLLIDLHRWREERVSERAMEYLALHPDSPYMDQDALNVVCDGLWKKLDPRWNFQQHINSRISEVAPEQKPGIIHFVTSLKPWQAQSLSLNAGLYDSYRSRTRFARTSRDNVRDMVTEAWYRLKRVLRQYRPLWIFWKQIKRQL
jgi:lipopolysaccharide biosynthesis glycosyltransferase